MTAELPMVGGLPEFNEVEIRQEVKRYKALGDETRLKMFRVLETSEHCVCELMDIFQLNQSLVSHHVKVLENAGLVLGQRVGKFVYYRVNHPMPKDV
ncbi:HTH ArsR-type DNA-binding domain protein [Acididesulfobacillus acetoxydans]|uniref:HTH ArsR-type DNA-binding domain protein n=1 Tax=Acididesulfobacillus acetoxydans TaxID=1561005 RepID=A0A8S0Y321_9FIRM|nr:metalloregulator ArsR/SmtB family transcription factor [Acididesulfobacillus acetoxydans]CAA7601505.1 HTH ArsR-type DNA-binding domain protein [Acididesulfobacillus acetoxydans]CEJ06992.1 helix_turn_helix, Arsenical Resistance Operon Repressor [Acididesulfobacillus acetoxydans]